MANDIFCCLNLVGDRESVIAFTEGRVFDEGETSWEADIRQGGSTGWTIGRDRSDGTHGSSVCFFARGEVDYDEVARASAGHPDLTLCVSGIDPLARIAEGRAFREGTEIGRVEFEGPTWNMALKDSRARAGRQSLEDHMTDAVEDALIPDASVAPAPRMP